MFARLLLLASLCGSLAAAPAIGQQGDQGKELILTRSAEPTGQALYTSSHALIIGINKYPNLPKTLQLQFAEKDATTLRDVLVSEYGFASENVTVLTNEKATLANIRRELSQLASAKRIKPDDRILIYFSGHGQTVKLPTGGEMGFLVPSDAKIDLNDPTDAGPYLETCLPMRQVWDFLSSSPAKHAAVIADACFSGMLVSSRSVSMSSDTVKAMLARPARQVLTAGSIGQKTFERQDLGHGVFTFKLLEELRVRAADKGKVFSLMDLYMSLSNSVANATSGKQIPQFGSYETEGQMLFCAGSMLSNPGAGSGTTTGGSTPRELPETPKILSSKLSITSNPSGAAVFINGEKKGSTPYSLQVALKDGDEAKYKIRLEQNGYVQVETDAVVRSGENTSLPVTMVKVPVQPTPPMTATLTVQSNPSGAVVYVDGVKKGTTPYKLQADLKNSREKTYRIRVEKDGYDSAETEVTAARGETLVIPLTLLLRQTKPRPEEPVITKPQPPRQVKALAVEQMAILPNTVPVAHVSFSPDGKWLASTGLDYSLSLFEIGRPSNVSKIAAPKNTMVRITPDWSQVLFVKLMTDGAQTWANVEVKETNGLKTKKAFRIDLKPNAALADVYAGNGRLILCGMSGGGSTTTGFCAVADFEKGEATLFSSGYRISSATGSSDGSTYAVYVEPLDLNSTGFAVVIPADLSKPPVRIPTEDCNSAADLNLSDRGNVLAVTCQKVLANGSAQILGTRIYDAATGSPVQFLPKVRGGALLADGAKLIGWRSQIGGPIVEMLDVKSGNGLGEVPGTAMWLSRDQRTAAQAAADGTITVFRLK